MARHAAETDAKMLREELEHRKKVQDAVSYAVKRNLTSDSDPNGLINLLLRACDAAMHMLLTNPKVDTSKCTEYNSVYIDGHREILKCEELYSIWSIQATEMV